MQCPVCRIELKIADRQGVEVDYCPQCRGVWLDRGELDKIIDRSDNGGSPAREEYRSEPQRGYDSHDHHKDGHDNRGGYQEKKKERGGFLGDILGGFGD
jgi:uncharacterized protein